MSSNQQGKEEITRKIEIKIKTQHTQRLWDTAEAGLREKFIAVNLYIIKEESSQINNVTYTLQTRRIETNNT